MLKKMTGSENRKTEFGIQNFIAGFRYRIRDSGTKQGENLSSESKAQQIFRRHQREC
jgi:hypothetical protein